MEMFIRIMVLAWLFAAVFALIGATIISVLLEIGVL